jgi:DoxX-like family
MPQHDGGKYIGRRSRIVARAAVAAVWLYEGAWCKLLARCPAQAALAASMPGALGRSSAVVLPAIGVAETALAVWIASGWRSRASAWTQTVLLVGMNGAGLVFGRDAIADPGAMVTSNVVLLVLAWIVADARGR